MSKGPIKTLFKDTAAPIPGKPSSANYDEFSSLGDSEDAGHLGKINLTSYDIQGTSAGTKPGKGVGEYDSEY